MMKSVINARELRAHLSEVVEMAGKGGRLTVLYRSRPAFDIVPVGAVSAATVELEKDSLYHAPVVGKSANGCMATKHDEELYK
jgi:prevent-host-death family protein